MTDSNAHGAHSLATGPLHIHFDRIAILLDSDIALVPLLEQIGQQCPPPPTQTVSAGVLTTVVIILYC